MLKADRLTRRLVECCAALAAVACASAPAPGPSRPADRVIATDRSDVVREYDPLSYSSVQLDVSRDSVFSALRSIYADIGVDILLYDPGTGEIGNRQFIKSHQVGSVPLHRYVQCGTTLTGPAADSYRVQMSLISYVTRQGTGTAVKTQLTARANDPGSSKGWVECVTTGVLEERIGQMLKDRFGRKS